ncbi:hypothetical protein ACFQ5B_15725 [Laceyella putida]
MKKALSVFGSLTMSMVVLFGFSGSSFASTEHVTLRRGATVNYSYANYLNAGNYNYISVSNTGHRTIYYRLYNERTGRIMKDGYLGGYADTGTIRVGGTPDNYILMLKCTTGRTVYKDCNAEGYLWDE